MTFLEAKIKSMCSTRQKIFEEAYGCTLPEEVKNEDVEIELKNIQPLVRWLEGLK